MCVAESQISRQLAYASFSLPSVNGGILSAVSAGFAFAFFLAVAGEASGVFSEDDGGAVWANSAPAKQHREKATIRAVRIDLTFPRIGNGSL
jgi:hypothetical protein